MSPRFKTARFHISSGPTSLFERVHYKMTARMLKIHSNRLQERAIERNAPLTKIIYFNPKIWSLITTKARTDTSKFLSTA